MSGISEETAQELINRINAIRSHTNPFERIVFGGGRNHGKSCLQEISEALSKLNESAKKARFSLKVDLGKDCATLPMPKERCIKLLEAYRAEREKVAKGRRFERCLRDGVVNEAIERAIELLKEGGE